jgi:RimJ/RimL family protein N-acetyltransferase
MKHPDVYPFISDDGSPTAEDYEPKDLLVLEQVYFLSPADGVLFMLVPVNSVTYEVHTCILPDIRGASSIAHAKELILWMFTNTRCEKIVTTVPVFNLPALALAIRAGMKQEGVNRRSFLRRGVLYDQTMLGVCKQEVS